MLSVHNKRFSCVLYAGILYINFNCWQKIIENHFVQYKKYFNIYSNFMTLSDYCFILGTFFVIIDLGAAIFERERVISFSLGRSPEISMLLKLVVDPDKWFGYSHIVIKPFIFLARCFLTFSYWYIAHQRFNFPMSKDCSIIFLIYGYFAIFWFSAGGYHLRADLLL